MSNHTILVVKSTTTSIRTNNVHLNKKQYFVNSNFMTLLSYILGTAWRSGLHVWLIMWRSWIRALSKAPVVSLSNKLYPCCLVLVGSRNGFER